MAAPTPPNFDRNAGLINGIHVVPPEGTTITYPSDLGIIQTINGVSYGVQITAYEYKAQTFSDFLFGASPGLVASLAAGILSGAISTRAAAIIGGVGGIAAIISLVRSTDFSRLTPEQQQQQLQTVIRNEIQNRQTTNNLGNALGTVNLQLPVKINDQHTLTWSQESAKAIFDFTGLVRIADVIGSQFGVTVNPALFMMFHHPNFKTIDMSWQFAAHNEQESVAIANIINFFKYHSSPKRGGGGAVLNYPSMFTIRLFPNDQFTFRIKPCIIEYVVSDFSPAGYPSFNRNGAPVAINMGIRFKEIDIWTKDTWDQRTV